MRIQNSFIGLESLNAAAMQSAREAQAVREKPARRPGPIAEYTEGSAFLRLLGLARQEPEVREERLREVAQRLASGDYLTREAAQRTAGALLAAPE